jgi:hypothetical protein
MNKYTLCIDEGDDGFETVVETVESWAAKWTNAVRIANYSSGGWEHLWDVEASDEAIQEIPSAWLCSSEWAGILKNKDTQQGKSSVRGKPRR